MIKVIGVRFRRAGKVYYFNPLDMDITTGMHVIVETARGVEYGYVVLGVKDMDEEKVFQPLKPVIRIATPQDDAVADENRQKEQLQKVRLIISRRLAAKSPTFLKKTGRCISV